MKLCGTKKATGNPSPAEDFSGHSYLIKFYLCGRIPVLSLTESFQSQKFGPNRVADHQSGHGQT